MADDPNATVDAAITAAELNAQPEFKSADELLFEKLNEDSTPEPEEEAPVEDNPNPSYEIDGETYDVPTLREMLATAKDAREVKAEATRKFQEAAEIRKETEPYRQLKEAWANGGPEERAVIAKFFQTELGKDGPEIPEGVNPVGWDDMSDEGKYLYKQNAELRRQIAALQGMVLPALEDVKGYVGQSKAEREAMSQAKAIKDTYGIDMTPEQIAEMKESLSDPIKAIGYLQKLKGPTEPAKEVEKPKASKAIEAPNATSKVFDPTGRTADDIIALMIQGFQPMQKA